MSDATITASDEVSLVVNGMQYSGWTAVRALRSLETFPNTFDLSLTEAYPGEGNLVLVKPGQSCVVLFGQDAVVTGWIDRVSMDVSPREHTVTISGRGKCADLLDCTVDTPGCSLNNLTVLQLAQFLAQPYGVQVLCNVGDSPPVRQINYFITQTPYEIIGQVARATQFVVYEDGDGYLQLDQYGDLTQSMSSGFVQGENVESFGAVFDVSQRYSDYRCYRQSVDYLKQAFEGLSTDPNAFEPVLDQPGAIRHRVLAFVAEQAANYELLAHQQAIWELNRRIGRSQQVTLTCDSWRDKAGELWAPNRLVAVHLPAVKVVDVNWLIVDVTFRRDLSGTHADLRLMPPSAFQPQPAPLYLFDPGVLQALQAEKGGAN